MNRRSFLGLLPFAPIVGPALAKEAATAIAAAVKAKPSIAGMSIKFTGLTPAISAVEPGRMTLEGVIGAVEGRLASRVGGVDPRPAEPELSAPSQTQTTEDEYPSPDILPI